MANYEFFSGVFKDFEGEEYPWGSILSPATITTRFLRFIRIDFHSHYGNEYYCPISLLRVYGLTHLEQWKWDMWEAESKAKKASPSDRAIEVVAIPKEVQYAEPVVVVSEKQPVAETASGYRQFHLHPHQLHRIRYYLPCQPTKLPLIHCHSRATQRPHLSFSLPVLRTLMKLTIMKLLTLRLPISLRTHTLHPKPPLKHDRHAVVQNIVAQPQSTSRDGAESSSSLTSSTTTPHATPILPSDDSSVNTNSSVISTPASVTSLSTTIVASTSVRPTAQSSSTVSIQHAPPPPPPSPSHGSPFAAGNGESIYRVIMNRLMALETNHTLYARLSEDVGRLDGIVSLLPVLNSRLNMAIVQGKGQAQMFSRTVKEWEKYRNRADNQYVELMHRVNYLADEVMLEKRLGIAQLCLLLAVLVFMGLTRGSRMSEGDLQSLLAQRIADRDRRERDRERMIGRAGRLPNAGRVREWVGDI
ncbi:UNC C-terminal-domain-containing protein [Salix suchowensis]|nr:UNC C-terminal-domain-containing protein [Salix suchowensis]